MMLEKRKRTGASAPPITWAHERVKLGSLIPWAGNPRMSSKKQAARIANSLDRFGQVHAIAIAPDGTVYDGHQRLSAWKAEYGADYEVDVRRASRALTDDEQHRLVIALHSGAYGQYDPDILSGWDAELLKSEGMDKDLLKSLGTERAMVAEMLRSSDDELEEGNKYTDKITAPIYTPKMARPPAVSSMFDIKHVDALLAEIDSSSEPAEVKNFLRWAAYRHCVIDFSLVAEFYAHAPPALQRLMESNALVIIDFNRAIELGHAKLTKDIMLLSGGGDASE